VSRRPIFALFTAVLLLSAVSCINVNVPIGGNPSSAAIVWTLDREHPESWGISSNYVIRIKDFSSVPSLQRTEIVVLMEDGSVNRASSDVWTARPMQLLPDHLSADLIDTGNWGAVLRTSTMLRDDFIVEGYVRAFGGRESAGTWEAILEVDLTVLDGTDNSLVYQKNYSYSRQLTEPSYRELTSAMSILVGIFDEEVMGDIWSVMLPIR